MKISNKDFRFFGKKKKKNKLPYLESFKSLESLKLISLITGAALAVNRTVQERLRQQQLALQKSKQTESDEIALIIAGFVGGALAGAISALLFTPESGEELRKRITGYFENGNGHETVENVTQTAKKKASEVEKKINGNDNE